MKKIIKKLFFEISGKEEETEERIQREYILKVGLIPAILIISILLWIIIH